MSSKKISQLLATAPAGALTGAEAFHSVDDPTGTPVSKGALISAIKDYVFASLTGPKEACRAATTANVNLATVGLAAQDGVSIVAGDRIFVGLQTAPAENGIYLASAGAWTRAPDADTAAKVAAAFTSVKEGATWAGYVYQTTFKATDTLGTDPLVWYQMFSESGAVIEDTLLAIYDASGTKLIYFDAAGASGTGTWLLTPPGGAGTHILVSTTSTDTLTNKTLTAPSLDAEKFSVDATVTAGTNAQGQGAMTKDLNIVTTTAANPSGVTLPSAVAGRRIRVVNKGTNPINVYPDTSDAIDGLAVNASIQIPVNGSMVFDASSASQWYSSARNSVVTQSASDNSTAPASTAYADAQATLAAAAVSGKPFELIVAISDETTDLTTGAAKVTLRLPRAVTLTKIKGSLSTAATGATLFQFDVNKTGVGSLFSTNPTFDASEKTTESAATLAVLSTTSLSADDELTFDIDAIGNTTPGKGLKVTLIGTYQ